MSYGGMPAVQEQERPRLVEIGASLLAVVGLLIVGRIAFGVLINLTSDGWHAGARAVFLVLNGITLIFALFILLLAYHVRRGRQWAWIVSIVMLPFTTLFGGMMLLITAGHGAIPWAGTGVVAASIATLLVLTASQTVRGYFARRPAPVPYPQAWAVPGQPWGHQPAVPGQPWGPGHPPA